MHALRRTLAAAALACASPALAQEPPAPADSAFSADAARDFVHDLADPVAGAVALGMGLYDHLRNEPDEWGRGGGALAQRVASRAGGHVVGTSVRHGLAAALGRSTRYEPCACSGAAERVEHVLVETFTDRDRAGRRVLSEPYLAGTLAGALAPAAWHPDVTVGGGLKAAGLSVALTVASRVLLELVAPP